MNKQNVSTVDAREVKFFETRKEAREYNRKNGTIGVRDAWYNWMYKHINTFITTEDFQKRWFVFLDTKIPTKGKGTIIPSVCGIPVKFFPTRQEARSYYWKTKGFPARYCDLNALIVPYEGNTNNYRWFVFL